MAQPDTVSEQFISEFLQKNGSLDPADLEIVLANAIRYSPDVREPILGFGDDVEGIVRALKRPVQILKDKICEEYCGSEDLRRSLDRATDVRRFIILATTVMRFVPAISGFHLDAVGDEVAALLALLLFGQEVHHQLKKICDCGQ